MQNDFIDGSLGSEEAVKIVDKVNRLIEKFDGPVLYTRDTHYKNYMKTQEGKNLPVSHCIEGTKGWQITSKIPQPGKNCVVDKPTFGSTVLAKKVVRMHKSSPFESITLVGLCTDICVISNALILKAALPEVKILVNKSCCAGTSVKNHNNALKAMACCQIEIVK